MDYAASAGAAPAAAEPDEIDLDLAISRMSPEERASHIERMIEKRVKLAREDFNEFAEMVAVDDETGEPLEQAAIHRRWAKLCDEYDRLLIWSHINSGKTTQLSILRTVWELGRDPTLRVVILSNTSSIATKIVKAIGKYIVENEWVHRIFPDLKPDYDAGWTNTELTVVRNVGKKRRNFAKDPSVRAVGVHGSLTSGRVDRLIVDDILDPENTKNEEVRKSLEHWYKAVAVGRLTRRARVLVVGTAYHPKDLLHTISKQRGWKWFRFPVMDANGFVAWPDYWPPERIAQKREELGPAEFARQMLCKARDDGEARFKQEWIDLALAKGDGLKLVHQITDLFPDGVLPLGYAVVTGVDLGVKKKKKSDQTVLFTFLEDPKGNRRILEIWAGKFTGPEILKMLEDVARRLCPTWIVVENVAAQDFILQFAKDGSNIPVVPHTTSKAKHDPILGVEGLAVELANGKWTFPNVANFIDPEVEELISEMLFYTPSAHTGDRLMACYFARDIARRMLGVKGTPTVGVRVIGGETALVKTGDTRSFAQRILDVKEPEQPTD